MLNTTYPMHLTRGTINGAEVPAGYMEEAALAREIVEHDDTLPVAAWRTLQAAIKSGLPVVLVTREKVGGRPVRVRKTVIVEYAVVVGGPDVTRAGNLLRVHYWGFGHNVWLADIVEVSTPDVEYLD
ncbi:hypothetical protein I5G87_gp89 [Mycobacterium phage Ekdilam]|uniref:Uncharacterized protein n=1 Tax=Mycobacterium phage Ekdilam TaxID=2599862 RepID=A0A5J6TKI4_9CAUD|nr:hypothetical protein I5G87_gp89 [Mycobacterium phage Ekdilam]QFG11513.1 hypothetical protein PBI_EKDILAM_89 [Mycobacterium phage Ekdilam]